MSAQTALARGRRAHEKLMVDRCTIHAVSKSTTLNEATGQYDDVKVRVYPPASVSEDVGPCKLAFAGNATHEVDAAGQMLVDDSGVLDLPIDTSTAVKKNHIVTYFSSETDPDLPGTKFRVEKPSHETYSTARRFKVEEVS